MSKSPNWAIDLQKFVFRGQQVAWSGVGTLYVSLHSDDPADGGTQAASELSYQGYARVAVPRNGASWSLAGTEIANAVAVEFPPSAGSTQTATHFGIGIEAKGAGYLLYSGVLENDLTISAGIQPRFSPGRLKVKEEMT
jgi:hypothetical protein